MPCSLQFNPGASAHPADGIVQQNAMYSSVQTGRLPPFAYCRAHGPSSLWRTVVVGDVVIFWVHVATLPIDEAAQDLGTYQDGGMDTNGS
jgi:hypothetical protein